MTVHQFYQRIASSVLQCPTDHIRVYVDDKYFLHTGTIVDRFYPDAPDIPTVFLYKDCIAQVRRLDLTAGDDSTSVPDEVPRASDVEPRRTSRRTIVPRDDRVPAPVSGHEYQSAIDGTMSHHRQTSDRALLMSMTMTSKY
jgi:hypothetical protein